MDNLQVTFFYVAIGSFLVSSLLYFWYLVDKNTTAGTIATALAVLGFVGTTLALGLRIAETGRTPFTDMYEYSTSFAWGIVLIYLFAEYKYKYKVFGAFVMPVALLIIASTLMLDVSTEVKDLPAALQSNWLHAHVAVAIIAYGSYAVSFGLAIMFLIKNSLAKAKSKSFLNHNLPDAKILDELSYRFIAFAFPWMSLVIITGAIWAEYAWGRYWSWDPKETWSLITWLVYAAYLHARFTYGWKGNRAAWLAIIGFVVVLFTYFGVNMWLSGLHSYATPS